MLPKDELNRIDAEMVEEHYREDAEETVEATAD
jgi:V/A-type H+-transporting ATPase subunit B